MGMFDTVLVPCPRCGTKHEAQSKGGSCTLMEFELTATPQDVLADVNRHAPFTCENCGVTFMVVLTPMTIIVSVPSVVTVTGYGIET